MRRLVKTDETGTGEGCTRQLLSGYPGPPPETINAYLDEAYELGKGFSVPRAPRASLATN